MSSRGKIDSKKILVKDVFINMWFSIPVYQRPYVWGTDEVSEILDDLTHAMTENPENPDFEYFFGSFVFQSKAAAPENGRKFPENDLLDGQQRMATILMLLAVIRDFVVDCDTKDTCQKCIYQKKNEHLKIPEQTRLAYVTRPKVTNFINEYIKTESGTEKEDKLSEERKNSKDLSVKNMANAVLVMRKFFLNDPPVEPTKLLDFLLNNVLFISLTPRIRA
jgi:uncharacterized protein with ParB-like and HNH nuclease domain